jgi:hypothetical protein
MEFIYGMSNRWVEKVHVSSINYIIRSVCVLWIAPIQIQIEALISAMMGLRTDSPTDTGEEYYF